MSQQHILSSTTCIETVAETTHELRQDSVQIPFEASNFHKLKHDFLLCFDFNSRHVSTCFAFCPRQDDFMAAGPPCHDSLCSSATEIYKDIMWRIVQIRKGM